MTGARIVLRNLTANWIGHGAGLVVMFFLSPFIVHTLGVTEYGIWQLLTVLTGYMGVLDLGVRASTGRYIILFLGQQEYEKVDETIRTGLGLYTVLSGLILFAGFILGLVFPWVFPSVPQEYHMTVAVLLPVLAVNIWISALRTILSSLLAAYDRFDLARGSDLIMLAVRTIGTIVVLKLGMGLIGLTIAIVGCNIVGLIVNLMLCNRIHSGLKLWPLMLKKDRMKELYNYGIGAFVVAVSAKIIGQTDLLLVGNLISIDSVAVYSIGAMLIYYSDTFTKQIYMTFFPSLQRAVAQENFGEVRWILNRLISLSLILGILMYVGYAFFGVSFITLWMFDAKIFPLTSVESAAKVMAILSCAKLLLLLGQFSRSLLAATGHISFSAKMTIVEAMINLILSISFVVVFDWGLTGIAAGTLGSHLLIQTILVPHYACKKVGMSWGGLLLSTGSRGLIAAGLFSGICFGMQHLFTTQNWFEFFIQVAACVLCYIPIALLLLVSSNDKKRLWNKIYRPIVKS
ncbi:putative O-antigen and teichonic acid transporter [Desulforapulum autotrophicum HRM2]|uniref:O-antigen and teichonic acid transporter n=1 Tax=Desulforapulum autotrophicum (strain ATCC 43914 / DSM 3382 / VKM B-1955 / HRM2) TaxID=177437 RepID=C0QCL2_DESAH|nr:polysaccharide biosynthesis C-terminal domain-containing protein [Desulforapulum autotrophicum]ACN15089.1 putative O-antigen and teichonic acid transporter [Desulforapulum autotrophicum HRM2]